MARDHESLEETWILVKAVRAAAASRRVVGGHDVRDDVVRLVVGDDRENLVRLHRQRRVAAEGRVRGESDGRHRDRLGRSPARGLGIGIQERRSYLPTRSRNPNFNDS